MLHCLLCAAPFHGRSDAVYCSSACRQKAYRTRTARRLAAVATPPRSRRPVSVAIALRRAELARQRSIQVCRVSAERLEALGETRRRLLELAQVRR